MADGIVENTFGHIDSDEVHMFVSQWAFFLGGVACLAPQVDV